MKAERKEELKKLLNRMHSASMLFYGLAIDIGVHPFIEFNGFMNEYIKICRNSLEADIDFTEATAHSGLALKIEDFEVDYLAEKFECIFGPTFASKPELAERFMKAVLRGGEEESSF